MTVPAASSARIPQLTRRLSHLRHALWRWLCLAGAARLVWLLMAILVVDAAADWMLEWDRGIRIAFAAAVTVGITWAVERWFVRPMRRMPTDAQLAWRVERAYPETAGWLVNAVELAARSVSPATTTERSESPGASAALVAATLQRAEHLAAEHDFTQVLDSQLARRHRRAVMLGLVVLATLVTTAVATTGGRTWYRRNVLFADIPWPRSTQIHVVGVESGRLRVARGGATVVQIEIAATSEQIPEVLEIDFRPRRSQPPSSLTRRSSRQFELSLRDLLDSFRFRVRGGDGRTEWIDVELIDPPWLRDVRITAREPDYLGGKEIEFAAGAGAFKAPRGSRVEISGVATKPLQSATLFRANRPSPLDVSAASRFTGQFTADTPGSELWSIDVRDVDGLSAPRPEQFRLEIAADPPPDVRARWRGASRLLVPGGAITLDAEVRDNSLVTNVLVLARSGPSDAKDDKFVELALDNGSAGIPAPQATLRQRLDLNQLGLRLGDVVELTCAADDNDVLYGPARGRSASLLLRVVAPAEFRADAQRREKEQRQHLLQSLDDHAVWLEQLRESDQSSAQLLTLARRHAALTAALTGPLEVTKNLVDELSHQFSESTESAAIERLDKRVVAPLARAHDDWSAKVQAELDAARRLAQDARNAPDAALAPATQTLTRALAAQEQLVDELCQAITALASVEGFQEAVTLLEELLEAQDAVRRQTTDAEEARIRATLDQKRQENGDRP